MNILMTGTEGTVGSALKLFFKNNGYSVEEFKGDIRDKSAWEHYKTRKFNGLIHLAALAGVRKSFEDPELYYDVNVNGTHQALKFGKHFANKVLYASSSNAYEWWGNPYAATKQMNEAMAKSYDAIGMRFHTVWPGRPDMLFKKLVNKEVTYINENHHRDWIHIDDLCNAILTIYQNYNKIVHEHPVMDIGTGNAVSVAAVARAMGFRGEYCSDNPAGERTITKANIEPLLQLGWTPTRNILHEASSYIK